MNFFIWNGWSWPIWAGAALLLIGVDAFIVNTTVVIWFGIGAAVVAAVVFLYPDIGGIWQIGIFAVMGPSSLFLWKWFEKNHPRRDTDSPNLNQRGAEYIGNIYPLESAMHNGAGRIKIGDTSWLARGEQTMSMPSGGKVVVVDVQGTTIIVKPSEEKT